jgi:orotate phosphoribosyltransferase-like protein
MRVQGMTYQEIADRLKIGVERARQLVCSASLHVYRVEVDGVVQTCPPRG